MTRANAFAFPHLQCLGFTEAAVAVLDDEQLCAIAAHELAHLDEPRAVRALRVGVALCAPLGLMVILAAGADYGALAPALAIIATLGVVLAFRRLSRRMEERADDAAHAQEPRELQTYATALERIYEANLFPAVLRRRRVHPHLYDRLLAAGVHPPYPRPGPPPRGRLWAMAIAPFGAMGLAFALGSVDPDARMRDESTLLSRMALTGGNMRQLDDLALLRWEAGDSRAAATLYRAQISLGDSSLYLSANLAIVLARDGLCDEARDALARVEGTGPDPTTNQSFKIVEEAHRAIASCAAGASPNAPR